MSAALRTWDGGKRCAECCNGDRCDDPTHHDRARCPNCKGTGWALWTKAGREDYLGYLQAHRGMSEQDARATVEGLLSTAQQPTGMKLGDILPRVDVQSIIGGGAWIELNAEDHPGAAFVVWRMEDAERSPECEERARRLVAAFNACAGVPVEVLEANAAGGLLWSVADQIDQRVLVSQLLTAIRQAEDLIANRWGYPADASSRESVLHDIRVAIAKAGSPT